MFTMPGIDNFNGRFNWYRWSAPVYEKTNEAIEAIKTSDFIGKRLRTIRILGSGMQRFILQTPLHKSSEEELIPYLLGNDPLVLEFEDGSTLEFLSQGHNHSRIGFNTIPSSVVDGMERFDPSSYFKFREMFDSIWQSSELVNFEVKTFQTASELGGLSRIDDRTLGDVNFYRFAFNNGCSIYVIPCLHHNGFELAFSNSDGSFVDIGAWVNTIKTKKDNSWSPDAFGGSVYIYPSNYKGLDPSGFEEVELPDEVAFICRQAAIAVSEDALPSILPTLWAKYFDASIITDWHEYEHYACNNYTREQMKAIIADLRDYIGVLDQNALPEAENASILSWANCYVWGESESNLDEAKVLLSDFLTQYCDLVEGMMDVSPDMHWVTVMGP